MQSVEKIKEIAIPILRSAGAVRAAIFGSYARGVAQSDSDVDMLVELPSEYSLLDYIGLKHEIEDALGTKVDLVEYDAIKPMIRDSIFANLLPIL